MGRVLGVVERRIPERHHRIAHEFVDGPLLFEDDVAQGREQFVQEARQLFGVEALGDRGEAAHVAEEKRHVASLASELQPPRLVGEPLDEGRRHVMAEGVAHAVPLALGAQENEQHTGQIDRGKGDGWIDGIDQPAEGVEGVPGDSQHRGGGDAAEHGAADSARAVNEGGNEESKHQNIEKLGGGGEVGPEQEGALQDLLDGLGMQLHPRHRRFKGRRPEIE